MSKTISLSQGQVAIVDDIDYQRIINSPYKWYAIKGRNDTFYAYGQHNGNYILMHRFILIAPEKVQIDHVDRNGLNNQRNNLRYATGTQNGWNAKIPKNNTSGYKGVYWEKSKQRWRAALYKGGKRIHLGYYKTAKEAGDAYDEMAPEVCGEYALLNSEIINGR